jgi:hypothetical protein
MAAESHKLITCIVSQGKGLAVLQALFQRGHLRAALGTARAPLSIVKTRGGFTKTVHYSVEKDILTVVASAGEADEVFEFLYERAGIGESAGGFLYLGPLARASAFALPAGLAAAV